MNSDSIISRSSSNSTVTAGTLYAGGLVGYNTRYSATVSDSYATGVVSATDYAGGLIGRNLGAKMLQNCYATGAVTGIRVIGGLIGSDHLSSSIISNCYSTGVVSGTGENVGGFIGHAGPNLSNNNN